jgi:hypothetical protein
VSKKTLKSGKKLVNNSFSQKVDDSMNIAVNTMMKSDEKSSIS